LCGQADHVKMQSMSTPARSYGGRSANERAEERRERLVEAAISVLAAQGERATMTAICQEAGLTERYFYESFANRDAALVAALDTVTVEIANNAVTVLQRAPGSVEERVHAMTGSFARWAATNPDRALVAVVQASATGPLRARRHELIGSFAGIAAREAATLYGDRAWPHDRARMQGLAFIGGLSELVASWLTGEVDMDTDELAEAAADLFVALSRRPSSDR
jgi:AcrR family transcriptional regulator